MQSLLPFKHLSLVTYGSYPGVQDIGVKRPKPGSDSFLHIGVCCQSFAMYVLVNLMAAKLFFF